MGFCVAKPARDEGSSRHCNDPASVARKERSALGSPGPRPPGRLATGLGPFREPRDRKDEGRALALPLFKNMTHPHIEWMLRINGLSTADGL